MVVNKIVLLACGSYSPPTSMHFRMFEIARDYFKQMGSHDVIGGIVSPVHDSYGKNSLVPSKHRASMVKLALQTSEWIRMSDWEMQQDQWKRTRLTLQYHQNYINSYLNDINGSVNEMIPNWLPENIKNLNANVQVKLLCGADLLESFATPGLWAPEDIEAIVGQHGIVVISRSGSSPEQFIFNSDILSKHRRNIHIVTNWVSNEISSTVVRKLMSRGQSVKYLIDDYVIDYIKKHNLFGVNDSKKYILTPNQNEMTFLEPPTSMPIDHHFVSNVNYINNRNSQIMNDSSPFEDMDETDFTTTSDGFILTNEKLPRPNVFCCAEGLSVKSLLSRASGVGQESIVGGSSGINSGGGHSSGQQIQIITDSKGVHHTTTTSTTTTNDSEIKVGGYIIREKSDDYDDDEIVDDSHHNLGDNDDEDEEDDGNVDAALECLEKKCDYCIKPALSVKSVNKLVGNIRGGGTISDDDFDNITIDRVRRASYGGGRLSLPSTSSRNNDFLKFVFTDHGIRVISDKEYVV